ncbi:MAG: hypothetical protein K2X87_13760 [Gemmataceae bacterium]|nr:hypothetical protein [Gemmataceae bacterium]
MRRYVYVFGRLRDDGFEVADAAGRTLLVSGYLACVDGRAAVRARWKADRGGLTKVRFADGQEAWVGVERPDLQVEAA